MFVVEKPQVKSYTGGVYCPICTHTVEGEILTVGKTVRVRPGQKCPRCAASLDAGYVLRHRQAA
jgi:hypothetical protein